MQRLLRSGVKFWAIRGPCNSDRRDCSFFINRWRPTAATAVATISCSSTTRARPEPPENLPCLPLSQHRLAHLPRRGRAQWRCRSKTLPTDMDLALPSNGWTWTYLGARCLHCSDRTGPASRPPSRRCSVSSDRRKAASKFSGAIHASRWRPGAWVPCSRLARASASPRRPRRRGARPGPASVPPASTA